jgi:hypothetical protein
MFANKRAINRLGIISLAHAPVLVTDFPVVNVHVDELTSARIWQYKLYATLSSNVNISYRLPIKAYYRTCTLRQAVYKLTCNIHGLVAILRVVRIANCFRLIFINV